MIFCERILNHYAGNDLTRIEILGEEFCRSCLGGGRYDECVPKPDLRIVFNSKSCCDVGRRDVDAPDRICTDYLPRRFL